MCIVCIRMTIGNLYLSMQLEVENEQLREELEKLKVIT